jgi:hypothetical protein
MHQQRNTAQILVDIIVTNNNKIQALRPVYDSKNPMPFTEPERTAWLKTVNPDRLNKRIIGNLGNRSLNRAKRLVNASIDKNGAVNNDAATKELGSLWVYSEDFIKLI